MLNLAQNLRDWGAEAADAEAWANALPQSLSQLLLDRLNALRSERDAAQTARTDLETQLSTLQSERDAAQATRSELETQLNALQSERETAQTARTDLETQLNALQSELQTRPSGADLEAAVQRAQIDWTWAQLLGELQPLLLVPLPAIQPWFDTQAQAYTWVPTAQGWRWQDPQQPEKLLEPRRLLLDWADTQGLLRRSNAHTVQLPQAA